MSRSCRDDAGRALYARRRRSAARDRVRSGCAVEQLYGRRHRPYRHAADRHRRRPGLDHSGAAAARSPPPAQRLSSAIRTSRWRWRPTGPFFVLGEVINAGQYPFVEGLTVQKAIAVSSGSDPHGYQGAVDTHARHGRGSRSPAACRCCRRCGRRHDHRPRTDLSSRRRRLAESGSIRDDAHAAGQRIARIAPCALAPLRMLAMSGGA